MDARSFITNVYRLAPPTDRPGGRIGSQVDAAYLAAVGEVVQAYGEVSSAELIGVELTQVLADEDGAEIANVERISDPGAVLAELDRDGEAVVAISVNLKADAEPVGIVQLSLRLER